MLLTELVDASEAVGATRSRLEKVNRIAAVLERLSPEEVPAGVAFLSGELRQRQIGVGWAALRDLPAPAAEASLTVLEVDAAFERIGVLGGPGSQGARRDELVELFGRATAREAEFLRRLIGGELRQGALEGVMVQALARAAGADPAAVQRAFMLRGDLKDVAAAALRDGTRRARSVPARGRAAGAPDAGAPGEGRRGRARARSERRRRSGSSTAHAYRSTGATTTCACTPAASTT